MLGAALGFTVALLIVRSQLPLLVFANSSAGHVRRDLILGVVSGAGLAPLALGLILDWKELSRSARRAEEWLWAVSFLLLAPAAVLCLDHRLWAGRHLLLLLVTAAGAVALESLLPRLLIQIPDSATKLFRRVANGGRALPSWAQRHAPLVVVVTASFAWAVYMVVYILRWHHKLGTHNFDLAINNNLMFRGLHGHFLESTVASPGNPGAYLANHAKFGAYLFLPIYALAPRPETLLGLQTVLLAAGALPLFWFARRHASPVAAMMIALCYLFYCPVQGAAFSEFQGVPVASFFILAAVAAAEARRWRLFATAAGAALLMREDVAPGLVIVGLVLVAANHRPRAGLILAVVSGGYFLILRFIVMPSAGSWGFHQEIYRELWADGQSSFASVIGTLLSNPLFVLSKVLTQEKLVYCLHLLVPIAFLPLRRISLWPAMLPGAVLTLLATNYDPVFTYSFYYAMHWAPYLFLAATLALGAERFAARRASSLAAMLFATMVVTYNYGAFFRRPDSVVNRGVGSAVEFSWSATDEERSRALRTLVSQIPRSASVAATEALGPHVSSRMVLYTLREGHHFAEFILASSGDLDVGRARSTVQRVLAQGEYGVVGRQGEFALLRKGADTAQNLALLADWNAGDAVE